VVEVLTSLADLYRSCGRNRRAEILDRHASKVSDLTRSQSRAAGTREVRGGPARMNNPLRTVSR
jgi:hypothetical protein